MDLEQTLRDRIKPELNFLYTEKPGWREGGNDFGWFCREHAYHTYFLCRMLAGDAEIVRGHVSLHAADGEEVLSSFGEDSDHAWVRVRDVCPVDLSFTLEYFDVDLPSIDLVYGRGQRGGYFVTYETGQRDNKRNVPPDLHHLRYAEHEVVSVTPESLLIDPFNLLKPGKRGGLAAELGNDIFDRITYHLYRVAIGEIDPFRAYVRPWQQAMKRIKAKNPDASQLVRRLLQLS